MAPCGAVRAARDHPSRKWRADRSTRRGHAPLEIEGVDFLPSNTRCPSRGAGEVRSPVCRMFTDALRRDRPVRTRDHTELALAGIRRRAWTTTARHSNSRKAAPACVHAGRSGRSFVSRVFSGSRVWSPRSNVVIHNVGLNPTRSPVLDVLGLHGRPHSSCFCAQRNGELVGDISIATNRSRARYRSDFIAQLIDELPAIAVLGPYTEQESRFETRRNCA